MEIKNKNDRNTRKKNPGIDISTMVYGKIPPQARELEEAVLGALTLESKFISDVFPILGKDSFYVDANQKIYDVITELYLKSQPFDILMVVEQLKRNGQLEAVGGPFYVTRLQNNVVSSANVKAHALKIEEHAIARRLIAAAGQAISMFYSDEHDVFEARDVLQDAIFAATIGIQKQKDVTPGQVAFELLKQIQRGMESGGMTGVPSGIQPLDQLTGGFQPQNLIVIGARTRHGKSAMAAAILHMLSMITRPDYDKKIHKSKSLFPAAFISMEMRNTEVFARLVSAELYQMGHYIAYSYIQRGLITPEELTLVNKAIERLIDRGIYIDDTPALTPSVIRAKVQHMIEEFGICIVFIDYIQLVVNGTKLFSNQAENISQNMSDFKNQAKEYDIPYILLSQVDRDTEKQNPREAVIADLKGSGGLEEKADLVLLLFNPTVNDINAVHPESGESERGYIYVNVAKNKQGETKRLRLPFDVRYNSFGSFDGLIPDEVDKIFNKKVF